MAVRSSRSSNRRAALFAALAVLALPSVAFAKPDDGERGERRHESNEARPDGANRGNWNQDRGQAVQREQPARPEPVQPSWRGPNTSGWTPPASPTGREASAPVARTHTGWAGNNRDGNDERRHEVRNNENGRNDGNRRNEGNGRGWFGRGSSEVATPAPGWRGPVRGSDERRVETRGDGGHGTRTDDHRDRGGSYRDGNRDGRSTHGWRDRNDRVVTTNDGRHGDNWRGDRHNGNWRGDRNHDSWRGDRHHDRDRSGYGDNHRRWDNNWRHNNRYDWHGYRNHNRDIFRWGSYHSPYRNYSYRRLHIGFSLDSLFFSNRYWINDPWQYRLPDAYGPYRWVRYYDDALLVDIYSGEVVDVINNFFW